MEQISPSGAIHYIDRLPRHSLFLNQYGAHWTFEHIHRGTCVMGYYGSINGTMSTQAFLKVDCTKTIYPHCNTSLLYMTSGCISKLMFQLPVRAVPSSFSWAFLRPWSHAKFFSPTVRRNSIPLTPVPLCWHLP